MKITLLTGKTFDLEQAFDFPLTVISSWRNRRLSLRIDSKKRAVVLTMPKFYSQKKAWQFVDSHQDWIEECLSKLPAVRDFADGEKISLFGQEVVLCYNPQNSGAPKLEQNILSAGGEKEFFHRRVKDFIKREAKKYFLSRSRFYADKLDCKVASVTIKDTKSRWGSCSSLNNINYSWRIALAPVCVIEYLMAHEVSHLKHPDHSPAFWRTVKTLYPGASIGRSWLKTHGHELYLYR